MCNVVSGAMINDGIRCMKKWSVTLLVLCLAGFSTGLVAPPHQAIEVAIPSATPASGAPVSIEYMPPEGDFHRTAFDELKEVRFLETFAEWISGRLVLPAPLKLAVGQCDHPGAYYVSEERTIVHCLELFHFLRAAAAGDRRLRGDGEFADAVVSGAVDFIAFHELGHAIVDLFDLPLLGREEDAADQIAMYLLLTDPDAQARQFGVQGALLFFRSTRGRFRLEELAGEHGLAQQRQVNVACWAYGSDPVAFAWAPEAGRLTVDRMEKCGWEFSRIDSAMRRLLGKQLRTTPASYP